MSEQEELPLYCKTHQDRLEHLEDKQDEQTELLVRIDERTLSMSRRLFGNGQPGEIHSLHGRITSLERWRWYLLGGASAVGAIGAWVRDLFMKH